ncbi:MAG: MerR family transcriptional regulator [Oscillospiraceae bacterium]|nr:MerR family transcriptional regulator [Oscillospiraceae bacterium]
MRYKIGDVARILGISPDLIRYYEEKGVVSPEKDPLNNYRNYDTWDINYLIDCLWYKNFGFGLDKVAQMVSSYTYDDLIDTFEARADEIRDEIRRQELLLERTQKYQARLTKTKGYVGVCDMRRSAEFVYYINRRNNEYLNLTDTQALSRRWLKYMPFTRRYFEVTDEVLSSGGEEYGWGFSLGKQYVDEFGITLNPPIREKPSQMCIHSAFTSVGKDKFSAHHLGFMLDYARENGYTLTQGAFGNLACSVIENGVPTGYFEVWIPVDN